MPSRATLAAAAAAAAAAFAGLVLHRRRRRSPVADDDLPKINLGLVQLVDGGLHAVPGHTQRARAGLLVAGVGRVHLPAELVRVIWL